jgi:uncharacterized repeat protein (TIGR03803 family)
MVLDSSGNLYGATAEGGTVGPGRGPGTLFEVAHDSGRISELSQFAEGLGYRPAGGLIADGGGNFYGSAATGGPSGDGTVFELPAGGAITLLASFNGANGAGPGRLLVLEQARLLSDIPMSISANPRVSMGCGECRS